MANSDYTLNEKALAITLDMIHVKVNSDILFDVVLKTIETMPLDNVNMLFPLVNKNIL
jgi:hypothetical protein